MKKDLENNCKKTSCKFNTGGTKLDSFGCSIKPLIYKEKCLSSIIELTPTY
ncbi:hypothetical protein T190115A13A_160007 [Tenacibaculum sp. 190524A02b]|uniref:Uncharacterized protein n=1 Tax=Tenacibaculum vairaonense TaxID=3137860 RepID=A0ABP1FAJ9_9FLAO